MKFILRICVLIVLTLVQQSTEVPTANDNEPYVLEREWEELQQAAPPLSSDIRGQRLVSALEAKLNFKVPLWWKTLIQSVDVGPEYVNAITDEEGLKAAMKRWRTSGPVRFSGFTTLKTSSDGRTVVLGDCERILEFSPQIAWDEDDEDWTTSPNRGISGMIVDNTCLVVPKCPTETTGGPYLLYCFDMNTGKLIWKADLLTGFRYAYTHVQFGSYTEVSVEDTKVIVWTGSEIAAMVQAFDLANGKPLLRFASNSHRLGKR